MIPLKSRIAALPGVGAIASLGCTLGCALLVILTISLVLGPVSWMGYLPSALTGAFFGVSAAWIILGATFRAVEEVNGAPFQKGDVVQILNGKHKGVKGKVEEPSTGQHGVDVIVDVDGESTVYGKLDIFLIERIDGETS